MKHTCDCCWVSAVLSHWQWSSLEEHWREVVSCEDRPCWRGRCPPQVPLRALHTWMNICQWKQQECQAVLYRENEHQSLRSGSLCAVFFVFFYWRWLNKSQVLWCPTSLRTAQTSASDWTTRRSALIGCSLVSILPLASPSSKAPRNQKKTVTKWLTTAIKLRLYSELHDNWLQSCAAISNVTTRWHNSKQYNVRVMRGLSQSSLLPTIAKPWLDSVWVEFTSRGPSPPGLFRKKKQIIHLLLISW